MLTLTFVLKGQRSLFLIAFIAFDILVKFPFLEIIILKYFTISFWETFFI